MQNIKHKKIMSEFKSINLASIETEKKAPKAPEVKQLKRIEDKAKTLPIAEIYTAVQSEGSRAGYPTVVIRKQDVLTDVISVKADGVIVGILVFTQKRESTLLMILLKHMMITLIYQK